MGKPYNNCKERLAFAILHTCAIVLLGRLKYLHDEAATCRNSVETFVNQQNSLPDTPQAM